MRYLNYFPKTNESMDYSDQIEIVEDYFMDMIDDGVCRIQPESERYPSQDHIAFEFKFSYIDWPYEIFVDAGLLTERFGDFLMRTYTVKSTQVIAPTADKPGRKITEREPIPQSQFESKMKRYDLLIELSEKYGYNENLIDIDNLDLEFEQSINVMKSLRPILKKLFNNGFVFDFTCRVEGATFGDFDPWNEDYEGSESGFIVVYLKK